MNVHAVPDAVTLTRGVTTEGNVGVRMHEQKQVDTDQGQEIDIQPLEKPSHNPVAEELGVNLRFVVDKETGKHVVKVLDPKSGDIIRQYPPEEFLQFVKNIRDLKGAFFSTRL